MCFSRRQEQDGNKSAAKNYPILTKQGNHAARPVKNQATLSL
jgi:hypothetical protein